ncbi:MAG TPA: formylglycine-generating enzyme family protein [Armatimonadota bacterium]|jgi:formylglycine-generating enzyme required for sulfatase activity
MLRKTPYLALAWFAASLLAGAVSAQAPAPFVNSAGMKLVPIKAGTYLFAGKHLDNPFLFPQPTSFTVTLDHDFYLGTTEVTQEQYQKVMGSNPSVFRAPNHPVDSVSWDEAMAFCQRLSAQAAEKAAGRVYSLPSERQWQFAARAGSDSLFPYGNDDETKIATVAVCRDSYTDARPTATGPAGGKQPNAWGLYDVLGNVWEWCLDCQPLLDAAGTVVAVNVSDYTSRDLVWDKGEGRVIVGGGWDNDFRACNLAARYGVYPTRKANDIGFRVRCIVGGEAK